MAALVAIVVPSGCRTEPIGPLDAAVRADPPAAVMIGRWEYARPTPRSGEPSLDAGLIVGLDIDSVAGESFFGHVSFWFAGDVGVSVEAFGPVSGSIQDGFRVHLFISVKDPSVPPTRVGGVFNGDRLDVQGSWCGQAPGPFPAGSAFVRAASES
jgi:hypothetical protein